ncbi:MAG: DUF3618 domain-containing protein, partial [Longispora sp.]|nr:DUF3618 domain-containing protein [Longispora sp. (in: high G+C Gram-positive bacteria)]
TQQELSTDVDALTAKVSPSQIIQRKTDRVRGALQEAKEKVMGTASQGGEKGSSAASTATDTVQSTASSVAGAVSEAPKMVSRHARGNPLAAGLIAFGVGWLVSSLLPASQREKELATQLKETVTEHSDVIKEEVGSAVQEVTENLREPAQEAVQSVKTTANEGLGAVQEEGKHAVHEVKSQVQS